MLSHLFGGLLSIFGHAPQQTTKSGVASNPDVVELPVNPPRPAVKDLTRDQVSVWLSERRINEEVCLLCAGNRSPHLILWYVPPSDEGYH
jgi:hypothetical protein